MRFSIIGEGSTDFRVLKTILESFFVDSEINSLVPVLDVSTLKTAKDEHGSWTKIPEYLSSQKPIIAIGPSGIASIDYLKNNNAALVLDDFNQLYYKVLQK